MFNKRAFTLTASNVILTGRPVMSSTLTFLSIRFESSQLGELTDARNRLRARCRDS